MTKTMTAKVTSPVTTAAAAAAATQPSGKKSPVPKQTATEKKSPKQTNSEQAAAVAAAATAAAVASAAAAAANATTASETKLNHAGADDAQPPDLAAEASQSNLQDSLRRLKLSRSKSRAGPAARTAAAAVSAGPAAPEIEQKSPTPARAPLVPPNNREKTEKGARVAVTSKPAAAAVAAAAAAPKPTASAAVKNTAASSSGIKGSAKASSVSSANKSAASKDRTEPVAPKAKASGDGDGGTVAKKSGAPAATATKEKPKPKVATKVPKPAEAATATATATATAATPTPTDASASAATAQSTPQADEGPAPPVSPARLSQLYTEVSFSLRGQQLKSEKSLKQARTSFGKLRAFFADLRRVAKTIQFPEEEVFQELLLRVAESTSGGPSSGFDDMAGSETVPMHNYKVLDRRSRLPSECGHKLDVEVSVDKAGAMLNAVHLMRELLRVKVEDANDLRMARSAVDNGALFFEGLSFYATKTATSELDLVSRECEIEAIDAPKK